MDGRRHRNGWVRGLSATVQKKVLDVGPAPGRVQGGVIDMTVPLSGLTSGRYVLEVSARLKSGRPVVREVPFEIK